MERTEIVRAPASPVRALARWAAQHCPEGAVVLEVGAGEHASGGLGPLHRRDAYLVGTDPDSAIERNAMLAERHRLTAEELARSQPGRYDVVLSVFVLEHVEDPTAFAGACAQLLRPGGSWFALTLNVHHYFGATAWLTNRLGVKTVLLHRLKGTGADHDHRFPTRYRLNSRGRVTRVCRAAGFDLVEFRVYDAPDRYAWYLPAPFAPLTTAWSAAAYRLGAAGMMGHLSFRARKAPVR